MIISENLKIGDVIYTGKLLKKGINLNSTNLNWSCPIKNINLFTNIHSVEINKNMIAKIVRSAGNSATIIGKDNNKAIIKLSSGWQLNIPLDCFATVGIVSNISHKFDIIKKAGLKRKMGFRPKVRGVAKNPCDHPHGGGNGKKSKSISPLTAWGRLVKSPTIKTKIRKNKKRLFKQISDLS